MKADTVCQECSDQLGRPNAATREFLSNGESEGIPLCDDHYDERLALAFWRYLTEGESPPGYSLTKFKPLSKRRSFQILYIVQEFLGAIRDRWEMCADCETLFNSEDESYLLTASGEYCENCRDGHGDLCNRCEESFDWAELVEDNEEGEGYVCKGCISARALPDDELIESYIKAESQYHSQMWIEAIRRDLHTVIKERQGESEAIEQ